jgi:hypothetical protein
MAGISWDAGWDGEVLSMLLAMVANVGKGIAIMPGRTSAFDGIYAFVREI